MSIGILAAIVGAAFWYFGSGRTGPMLVVSGIGAVVVGCLLMMNRGPVLRVLAVSGFMLVLSGLEAIFFAPARLIGALVVAAALALFLVSTALYLRPGRTNAGARHPAAARGRLAAVTLLLIVAVGVPLGGLGAASFALHQSGSVSRHYGKVVTVRLPDRCSYTTRIDSWGLSRSNVACPGATWLVGDQAATGTLEGRVEELETAGPFREFGVGTHVDTVDAYVYRDRAFTAGAAHEAGPVVVLGRLSPWLALTLPVALVAWFVLRRIPWWRGR